MLLWKTCIFYCLWTLILWKCSKVLARVILKNWLWLQELHLYLCAPCYFPLCSDVLTIHGIYLLFFNDPFHIDSIYHVLRSWVLCAGFINASEILFYRLPYTVCQVFKRFICQQVWRDLWMYLSSLGLSKVTWIFSVASSLYLNWALINCFSPKITGKVYS